MRELQTRVFVRAAATLVIVAWAAAGCIVVSDDDDDDGHTDTTTDTAVDTGGDTSVDTFVDTGGDVPTDTATDEVESPAFWEGDEASVQLDWVIDGATHTCADVGGSQVRMSVSETDSTWEWWDDFYWSCEAGAADTGEVFATGTYWFAWQLIDSAGDPISETDWYEHTLTAGTNDIASIDFETNGGAAVQWSWTIEGHAFDEDLYASLCPWATGDTTTIQLWVDVDADDAADDAWDAECVWGSAQVDSADSGYEAGQSIQYAFAMLDSSDTVMYQSESWSAVTLTDGVNDLGVVDFDLGDYGPLDVTLEWHDKEVDPVVIDCSGPPEIEAMGYLLYLVEGTDEWLMDSVDIDTDPMDCTTELGWLETDFGEYYLVLDGENTTDGYMWGATCIDLMVDDETSNEYACPVLMTESL
jgi:hypothetical protein